MARGRSRTTIRHGNDAILGGADLDLDHCAGRSRNDGILAEARRCRDPWLALGGTVCAALVPVRRNAPKRLVLAVPVAPPDTVELLYGDLDELICLEMPEFTAISQFYAEFPQLTGSADRPHRSASKKSKINASERWEI
jgi:hypothetical protein